MRQAFVRHQFPPRVGSGHQSGPREHLDRPLRIEIDTVAGGCMSIRPVGDLEAASVPLFREVVASIGCGDRVIIDMSGIPFIDSSGIGALIGAARRIRQLEGSVVLASARPSVARVLHLTGIDRVVEHRESLEEAAGILSSTGVGPSSTGQSVAS